MAAGIVKGQAAGGQGPGHRLSRRRWLALGLAAVAAAACKPIFANHGYVPTDAELALIEVGRDTRQTVQVTIGRPTAAGLLGDEAWYYVQSRWKSLGAAAPVEIDRQVVAITFDETGHVANVERFGLERGEIVAISRRVTSTNIRGKNILAQIFGNIGKLNTGDLFK